MVWVETPSNPLLRWQVRCDRQGSALRISGFYRFTTATASSWVSRWRIWGAISLGYDVARYKLLAFVLSTAIAGLAGGLKTLVLGFATLSDVHWSLSGEVVLMTRKLRRSLLADIEQEWHRTSMALSLITGETQRLYLRLATAPTLGLPLRVRGPAS